MNDWPTHSEPRGSFRLLQVAGIPIRVHYTFFLLPFFLAWMRHQQGGSPVTEVVFVVGVFACVSLHELGHALTARRFGILTLDITLYPIGGIARARSWGKAWEEFWIALAGPMVNVGLAVALFLGLRAAGDWVPIGRLLQGEDSWDPARILHRLFLANLFLAGFNLIPAFPLDGGRILRALLETRRSRTQATAIAARIGRAFGIGLAVSGVLLLHPWLVLIGGFVFIAARQEDLMQQLMAWVRGKRLEDVMETRFQTISHGERLGETVERVMSGRQPDFPVFAGQTLIGTLDRGVLSEGLAGEGPEAYVAGSTRREIELRPMDSPLRPAFEWLIQHPDRTVWVTHGDGLIGYIRLENILAGAMKKRSKATASLLPSPTDAPPR